MARKDDGFEEFVRGRSPGLLRTAYVLTGDRGHAEDLLQDVLVKMHRHWKSITVSPDAYARRALVHQATSRWRWRSRRPPERPWSPGEDVGLPGDASDPVVAKQLIMSAVAALPARQRAVIALRYLDDLSEAETALALGCSEGTVKSHASRGIARMREQLQLAEDTQHTLGSRK
jgi:RNA polymerase sigma-70 factor (sigma-E family)